MRPALQSHIHCSSGVMGLFSTSSCTLSCSSFGLCTVRSLHLRGSRPALHHLFHCSSGLMGLSDSYWNYTSHGCHTPLHHASSCPPRLPPPPPHPVSAAYRRRRWRVQCLACSLLGNHKCCLTLSEGVSCRSLMCVLSPLCSRIFFAAPLLVLAVAMIRLLDAFMHK